MSEEVTCPHCLGAGELEIAPERCPKLAYMRCLSCNGRGEIEDADSVDWRTSDTPEAEADRTQFEKVMRDRALMEDDKEMARED